MGRDSKLSKYNLEHGLFRWRSVSELARQMGVSRRTVQRAIKRERLDKVTVLGDKVAPSEVIATPATNDGNSLYQRNLDEIDSILAKFASDAHACSPSTEDCTYCREWEASLPPETLARLNALWDEVDREYEARRRLQMPMHAPPAPPPEPYKSSLEGMSSEELNALGILPGWAEHKLTPCNGCGCGICAQIEMRLNKRKTGRGFAQ